MYAHDCVHILPTSYLRVIIIHNLGKYRKRKVHTGWKPPKGKYWSTPKWWNQISAKWYFAQGSDNNTNTRPLNYKFYSCYISYYSYTNPYIDSNIHQRYLGERTLIIIINVWYQLLLFLMKECSNYISTKCIFDLNICSL